MFTLQRGQVVRKVFSSGDSITYALPQTPSGIASNVSVAVKGTGSIVLLIQASLNDADFDDVVTKTADAQFTQSVINLVAKQIKITTTTTGLHALNVLVS